MAAVVLPAAVALLFILATVIPKWTVPTPQHDLVLEVEASHEPLPHAIMVEFVVRDGQVLAVVRPVPRSENSAMGITYPPRWRLMLLDHESMQVREIPAPAGLPATLPQGETRTIVVDALAGRRVTPGRTAPDGYTADGGSGGGGTGMVGELFGMNRRYRRALSISRDGRTIQLELPAPYRDTYGAIVPLGWTEDERRP